MKFKMIVHLWVQEDSDTSKAILPFLHGKYGDSFDQVDLDEDWNYTNNSLVEHLVCYVSFNVFEDFYELAHHDTRIRGLAYSLIGLDGDTSELEYGFNEPVVDKDGKIQSILNC